MPLELHSLTVFAKFTIDKGCHQFAGWHCLKCDNSQQQVQLSIHPSIEHQHPSQTKQGFSLAAVVGLLARLAETALERMQPPSDEPSPSPWPIDSIHENLEFAQL
jgi:hypothetical protein